jgi:hypothetical protein
MATDSDDERLSDNFARKIVAAILASRLDPSDSRVRSIVDKYEAIRDELEHRDKMSKKP